MNRLPQYCPEDRFARGFQLKVDRPGFFSTKSGLEIIKFFCCEVGGVFHDGNAITSEQGKLGDWGKIFVCPNGAPIISVRIKEDSSPCDDLLWRGNVVS